MKKFYSLLLIICCVAFQSLNAQQTSTCTVGLEVKSTNSGSLSKNFVVIPKHILGKKPVEICWKFHDGSQNVCKTYAATYTGTYSLEHKFSAAGNYQVCVTVKYEDGCESTKCEPVTISNSTTASCLAELKVESTTGSAFIKVFTAVPSHSSQKKPVKIVWKFGDGTGEVSQAYAATYTGTYKREHVYATAGQYEACIRIIYEDGCESRKCQLVTVSQHTIAAVCEAGLKIEPILAHPQGRKFIAIPHHSQGKKPVLINWKFGDGTEKEKPYAGTYTGTYVAEHIYPAAGQYEVCVRIKYEDGCEGRKCQLITIAGTSTLTCGAGLQIESLTSTGFGKKLIAVPSHYLQKKPIKIIWKFGDGTQEENTYPTTHTGPYVIEHTYTAAGQYEACVFIKYEDGCESRKCQTVSIGSNTIHCEAHVAEVATSATNLERKFYVGLMSNKTAEKICWDFGDGTKNCVTLSNPVHPESLLASHKYPAPGVYKVCAKVYYTGGCVVERCREVVINPLTSASCGGYFNFKFIDSKTIQLNGVGVHNSNDQVTSYTWHFGDGTTGTGKEVKHTYATGGNYKVCLTIKTASGCEATICKRISVEQQHSSQLILTPNPVTTVLHAQFHSTRTENVSIKIFSANGVVLKSFVKAAAVGQNNWSFEVGTLPSGVYSVVVQSSTQFATAIFFK